MRELIQFYRKYIAENSYPEPKAERMDTSVGHGEDSQLIMNHLLWMLDEMERIGNSECDYIDVVHQQKAMDKLNRWLGFIQGVFATYGLFTIDELWEHTRRCFAPAD